MTSIGELADGVERHLGAMCLRWAADHGRGFCTAPPSRKQSTRLSPEAAKKWLSRFPLFTGDKVQIGITYYNLSPVKKVEYRKDGP
jgi:hypothetical protein